MNAGSSKTTEEKSAMIQLDGNWEGSNSGETQYALKFAGAALSNMAASGISNPFDVIKVRQQLLRQSVVTPGAQANAFWRVGIRMAQSEGFQSLLTGMTASMMREIVYSGIRLGTYEYFKDTIFELSGGSLRYDGLGLKVMAASVAATLGAAVANPTDLVKIRMQAHYPSGRPYRSTAHAFVEVYREGAHAVATRSAVESIKEGMKSLYRGVDATTVRGIVLSTSQICAYDHVKQIIKRKGLLEEGFTLHLSSSLFAGLFCSITSNPVDVVKVRLMSDKERQLNGVMDCIRKIMAREGPLAFYKGFGMCWARLGVHTIVSFVAFERFRLLVGLKPL